MSNELLVALLIIAYAVLAAVKLFVQSKYSKQNVKSFSDSVLFWLLIFFLIGIAFLPSALINKEFRVEIIIYAFLAGLFTVGFQLFYTLALKEGPVGLSAFMTSASSIVYIVYSIIVFNEKFTALKGVAIGLFVIALAFNIKKDPKKNITLKWWILITITCLFLIGNSIVNKYFAVDLKGQFKSGYLSIEYITSFIITGIILIPLLCKQNLKPTLKINKWFFIFGVAIAGILVACVYVNQVTTTIADMSFFTPIRGALVMALSILEGWIVFKEKPTLLQWIGIAFGVASTVLINF